MSFGHVGQVASIYSYADADKLYNSKPAHTRCKFWQPHERCLKERPSGNRHYRIEQHNDGEYYDVCLYSTVMARFYKPNANGHCRVLYAGHGSVTSQSFMGRVLGVWTGMRRNTTDGRTVIAPVYNANDINDRNDLFSLDMMLDENRSIIVAQSKHTDHYTHKSNAADKHLRNRIKERFSTYVTLAQMRMPDFADNCVPTHDKGRPFGGGGMDYNQRLAVEAMWSDSETDQHCINYFFDLCQDCYDTLASKRGYEQSGFVMSHRWYHSTTHNPSPIQDLQKPVTEKDLEKAVVARIIRILGADARSEPVLQPQFMDFKAYPRSAITTYR